jgi:POT family proton-dependent oligopeptide transporter
MPFVGAFLADSILGDYWTILFGAVLFYIPGLVLILLSSIPHALGETFNTFALSFGLLFMWPTGTGIVKSVVNVFGAKQFHPLLQSALIEAYYVKFYMCINIGALVGGMIVPVVAQHDVSLAYSYPVGVLCIGILLFVLGTERYVKHKPVGDMFAKNPIASSGDSSIGLNTIFRITALIIPFNIAYSQMATTFIIQGTVMEKAFGFIDAASMNNADAISVLFFGWVVGNYLYPALARRDIRIPTTYKFAIGSALGFLAIAWALFMEYKIRSTYEATGGKVSILWQSVAYFLIGAGEIFAVSAAYEVAFTASPPDKKVVASALNLFCVGGIPNVLCIFLYQAAKPWFRNSNGTAHISRVENYVTARVDSYFFVLLLISLLGIVINMLPMVRDFVASIEEKSTDLIKTPMMSRSPRLRRRTPSQDYSPEDEESPLLRMKRHREYLKYGSGPVLYKQGSMRAGPSLSERHTTRKEQKHMKKSSVGILYKTRPTKARTVVIAPNGKPLRAGAIKRQDSI